ncbi:MAG: GNAT family N-acetyltransferase [Fusobacteriaceae bacterium]|nr:GNAT family N-acetyltransferase [Fusobacteriaceae bacterium]
MEIRKTRYSDLPILLEIYSISRKFMADSGNPNQWINGYPTIELLTRDIDNGFSYVSIIDDQIVGTFCFIEGIEPTYSVIKGGNWLNDLPYGVVHRITTTAKNRGIASLCLDWCLKKCKNLRIDTHRDNIPMQKTLEKNGYIYCGIIKWEDGSERIAFQKVI